MSDDRTFQDAKRLYLEQYGEPMVTNTYLKIALTLVSVIAVGRVPIPVSRFEIDVPLRIGRRAAA